MRAGFCARPSARGVSLISVLAGVPCRKDSRMGDTSFGTELLRREIIERVRALYALENAAQPFVPGETFIPYSGRVFDGTEIEAVVLSALDGWITAGPYAAEF